MHPGDPHVLPPARLQEGWHTPVQRESGLRRGKNSATLMLHICCSASSGLALSPVLHAMALAGTTLSLGLPFARMASLRGNQNISGGAYLHHISVAVAFTGAKGNRGQ